MKTVSESDAMSQLAAILDEALRAPVVIQRNEQNIAVVVSMADYERLRAERGRAFLELRDEVAREATAAGLTEKRLAELSWDGNT